MKEEYERINIGDKEKLTKIFSDNEIESFAKMSLDFNPVHLDKGFAKKTIFKDRIVHGFLVGSLISAVIASKLPGSGSIYLSQNLKFLKPVYHNEQITAIVEVIDKRIDKQILTLKTICINKKGEIVIDGEAIIKLV